MARQGQKVVLAGLVLLFLLIAVPLHSSSDDGNLEIRVRDGRSSRPLSGVQVEAVLGSGEIVELAVTDQNGRVRMSKETLRNRKVVVLLFCKEYFFCGALRLDQEDFWEYDERSIHLAPFAI